MQTEEISNKFYVLTHDMATALDVLPLRLLDISDEVKEQIELVHSRARRAKLFINISKEQLSRDVLVVLDEFEKVVTPKESKPLEIFEMIRNRNKLGTDQNV
jgi:hypothetical protein